MFSRSMVTCTVFAAALVLAAGNASATETTTYRTGATAPLLYFCENFIPGISPQPMNIETRFDAPASVPSGTSITPTNVSGTLVLAPGPHALLDTMGFDGLRGQVSAGLTATGATLSGPAASALTIPETIAPFGGSMTIPFAQSADSSVPSLTAGAPGTATVSATSVILSLQYHKKANGIWEPATPWKVTCSLKVTNPKQNSAFTPAITVTE
ncbi:DUF6801 domain-containing protein [Spirillospora sp. NPDC048911]|uniref:DUF6801 domain-containing protein n=1 Tax=Spirillospora sp. NPDC048911 TaxID=3364527 RepID=UPI0037210C41